MAAVLTASSITDTPRPADIAWAQQLIADLQADEHLQQLTQKWKAAATAICQADYDPAFSPAISQLLQMGESLQQLGQPVGILQRSLQHVWEHDYAPAHATPAELEALHHRIFGAPFHAA